MDKDKALEAAVTQIERQFGKGSVMRLGDHPVSDDMQFVPTGSLALDIALGVGGIPRGRIVEIYGPESSGKTTMVYHLIAQAQRLGGQAAFIDAEHSMDPIYAKAIGVDVDNLLVSQPDYGEQALEIAEMLVRSGALDIVAIDSVAALTPKAEIEGEMGDSFVGLQARLMSQALRKLAGSLNRSGTICCFTNQLREKIGVMFGSPEVTTGGKALKFYATIRLDIRRIETLKDGTDAVGNRVRVKVVKNKVAPPFKQAEFDIMYGQGISREGTLLDLGVVHDVVAKSGAFFSYNDERLGQGRANAKVVPQGEPRHGRRHRAADPREGRSPAGLRRRDGAVRGAGRARGRRPGHRRGPVGLQPCLSSLRCGPLAVATSPCTSTAASSAVSATRSSRAGVCTKGASSTPTRSPQLRGQASAERVMADAYRLLGHRARSRHELRRRLLQKGHDDEAVAEALERLAADGLLDDAEFARCYVADKRGLSGWGSQRIRRGLTELGVDHDVIDAALGAAAAAESEDAELERALEALRRRGAPQAPLDAARRRAYQALVRRGFSTAVAYAAIRRWSGGRPSVGADET